MALQLARGEINAARAERNRAREAMGQMSKDAARGTTEMEELRCELANNCNPYKHSRVGLCLST